MMYWADDPGCKRSVYKGVLFCTMSSLHRRPKAIPKDQPHAWQARFEKTLLGTYATEVDGALAYDRYAHYTDPFLPLNFPDLANDYSSASDSFSGEMECDSTGEQLSILKHARERQRQRRVDEQRRKRELQLQEQEQHAKHISRQEQLRRERLHRRQQRLLEIQHQHRITDQTSSATLHLDAHSERLEVGSIVSVQFYEDGVPINYDGSILATTGRKHVAYKVKFFSDGVVLTLDPRSHFMQLVQPPAQDDPGSHPARAVVRKTCSERVTQCLVCQEDFAAMPKDKYVTTLGCGHRFCTDCIEDWFSLAARRSCPTCRKCFAGLRQAAKAAVADVFCGLPDV